MDLRAEGDKKRLSTLRRTHSAVSNNPAPYCDPDCTSKTYKPPACRRMRAPAQLEVVFFLFSGCSTKATATNEKRAHQPSSEWEHSARVFTRFQLPSRETLATLSFSFSLSAREDSAGSSRAVILALRSRDAAAAALPCHTLTSKRGSWCAVSGNQSHQSQALKSATPAPAPGHPRVGQFAVT